MRGILTGLIAILVFTGCGIGGSPVPMPTGPIDLLPGAPEPDGEITVAATGVVGGAGWRILVWESGDLVCRQLDLVTISNLDCGPLAEGEPFLSVTVGADMGTVRAVHGFVDESVESVSARAADGTTYDVPVIPGGIAGSGSGLLVMVYPATDTIVSITAYSADGIVLNSQDVR
ncbi:MAG: hypothetical protein ABIW50_06370 [Candidatus Limnocylindria bacterium]